jgi:hypothetical protein
MNTKLSRLGKNFEKELREIKILRRMDVDKKFSKEIGNARLTDGILKFPEWNILKQKLIKEPRKEEFGFA